MEDVLGNIFLFLVLIVFFIIMYAPDYFKAKRKQEQEDYLARLERDNSAKLAEYDRG